jgi:hypothetical protein
MTSNERRQGGGLDPATRVLTADLRWIAIADIEAGQDLVACDEHPHLRLGRSNGCRKMRTAVVETVRRTRGPAYRIGIDDGRSVICSAGHRWLSRKSEPVAGWRSLGGSRGCANGRDRLRPGDLVRAIAQPWGTPDPHDGWFGGIIDGEGSFGYACHGPKLAMYQCDGPVLVRMIGHCIARRYVHNVTSDRGVRNNKHGQRPVHAIHIAGMSTLFRVLGLSRPERFIGARWWEGRRPPENGWRAITAIEKLGEMDLVDIQTSTGTYIAEGFIAHGST